jgi:hypothetical protein
MDLAEGGKLANYFFTEDEAGQFENSDFYHRMQARSKKLEAAFAQLAPEIQEEMAEFAKPFLVAAEERESAHSQGLKDDDECAEESRLENEKILLRMLEWFPFVGDEPQDERDDYANAFFEMMDRRAKAN